MSFIVIVFNCRYSAAFDVIAVGLAQDVVDIWCIVQIFCIVEGCNPLAHLPIILIGMRVIITVMIYAAGAVRVGFSHIGVAYMLLAE